MHMAASHRLKLEETVKVAIEAKAADEGRIICSCNLSSTIELRATSGYLTFVCWGTFEFIS